MTPWVGFLIGALVVLVALVVWAALASDPDR